MRAHDSKSQSVRWSVGLSVADNSEHATYGDWPCFTIKYAIFILFVSEKAQKWLKSAIYQIFGISKTKKLFRGCVDMMYGHVMKHSEEAVNN